MASNDSDFDENLENLENILNISGKSLKITKIECAPGSCSGDNYMSVVKRVIITGVTNHDEEDFRLSLIIKRQIPSRSRRQLYRCDEAFNNEINAYTYVVPMLKNSSKCLPYPKCYFAGRDSKGELIILEDLKQLGYRMEDRLSSLDFDHCKLVMKELANLHATSIFVKCLDNHLFTKNRKNISEIVYCTEADEFYKTVLESAIRESLASLRSSNQDGSLTEPIRLIEKLQSKLYDIIRGYVTKDIDLYKVICHGDLWVNNIMFQRDGGGDLCSVKFFDLQAMRYASPVIDILHFIYTSTKRDIRDSYLTKILESYSSSLLSYLDIYFSPNHLKELKKLKNIYSLENIKNEFHANILYGLAVCMWVLPAVTFDPDNIPNLDEVTLTDLKTSSHAQKLKYTPEYHSRIKDIALEFYQKGFLNLDLNVK